ncbi:DUF3999 family protein [Luteibacter sp. PPL554]
MRRKGSFVALIAGLATAHAADAPRFAYAYPLATPPGANAYLVELPQDAYRWAVADAGLADVIVVDASNRPVAMGPYRAAGAQQRRMPVTVALLPVPPVAAGAVGPSIRRDTQGNILIEPGAAPVNGAPREWLLDAQRPIAAESLAFPSGDREANLNVDIDGSADLQQWAPLARDVAIVTVGRGDGAVQALTATLSGAAWRYYRVRVRQGEAPWDTGHAWTATLTGVVTDEGTRDDAPLRWFDMAPTSQAAGGQGVDYEVLLPAALPLSQVRATLGPDDQVARLDVAAVDGAAIDALGSLVIAPGAAPPTLVLAPYRRNHLRVHVSTPLRDAPRLSLGWQPDRFVFLPEGQPPYRLLVGSRSARRPDWPIGDALAGLRQRGGPQWRPTAATVGPGEPLAGRQALDAPSAPFDWTRPLLWAVLLLGAGVIIGMAASLLRRKGPGDR